MNNTFVEEIRNAVAEALEDKIVEAKETVKTNGVVRTGIIIRSEGNPIAPTIYINEDASVEENANMIIEAYKQNPAPDIDVSWISDYEQVKEKLTVMITSKPVDGLAKEKAPGFDDLYMHALIPILLDTQGLGNVKVTNEMVAKWGITTAELFEDAIKSAPINSPAVCKGMFQTFSDMGAPTGLLDDITEDLFMVLSNDKNTLGASAILYYKVKENTYMIPSSVHEVLLIDGDSEFASAALNGIINEVNTTVLAPEEFLSNHAYRFNGKKWENVA